MRFLNFPAMSGTRVRNLDTSGNALLRTQWTSTQPVNLKKETNGTEDDFSGPLGDPPSTAVIFAAWHSPHRLRRKQLPCSSPSNGQFVKNIYCSFTICSDNESLLKAIECRSPLTFPLRSLVNAWPGPTTLLGVPGHEGMPVTSSQISKPKKQLQPSALLLGPSPAYPWVTTSVEHTDPSPTIFWTVGVFLV